MPTNNKFTKVITTIVLPITVAAAILFNAIACKPEPDNPPPPICKCEAGTIHLENEPNNCNNMADPDCDTKCENGVVGERVYGIPVTNRDGVSTFNTILGYIQSFLSTAEGNDSIMNGLRVNIKEIEISDSKSNSNGLVNGKLILNKNTSEADIQDLINGIAIGLGLVQVHQGWRTVAATKNHSVPLHLTTPYRAHPPSNNA